MIAVTLRADWSPIKASASRLWSRYQPLHLIRCQDQSEASIWVTWSPLTNQRPAGTPHSNGKECGMWTWVEWNAATSHKPDTSVGWGPHEHQIDRDLQTHTNFPPVNRHICEFTRQLILLCTVWLAPQTGIDWQDVKVKCFCLLLLASLLIRTKFSDQWLTWS